MPTITGSGVGGAAGFRSSTNTSRGIGGETTGGTVVIIRIMPSVWVIGGAENILVIGIVLAPAPALIAPVVPLIDELPTVKGVVIPPPWRMVTAPSPAPLRPALQMLVPAGQITPPLNTRTRPPASIVIAPLLLPRFVP